MRILIYNRHFYPSIGGTEISGRFMAREFAALGHAVTVVTATPLPSYVAEIDEGYTIVRDERVSTLVRFARKNDVLFSRGGVSLRVFLAALCSGIPFVAFHEIDAAAGRTGSGFRRHVTDAVKALVRRQAALQVLVSDALLDMLELPSGSNWFRLYNPVPDELWTSTPAKFADRDLDIVFVGRLVASKGLLILRDALRGLPEPDGLRVAIAGNGNEQAEWERLFQEVRGEVAFLGAVQSDSLRDLYARARVVVIPSILKEGMGMVAAEALANGVPVCASDQPALREVVGDAGLFHSMGNAAALATDVERLLGDANLWQILSDHALAGRARFSMLQYRENLSALTNKIAGVGKMTPRAETAHTPRTELPTNGEVEVSS